MVVTPSDTQNAAIKAIVDWYSAHSGPKEFYLAGYAGTGKSTVVEYAIEALRPSLSGRRVVTAAYTGKAVSVLKSKGVRDAQTIHSLIYVPILNECTGEVTFELSENSDAHGAGLIVIDECSMADDQMVADLRATGRKILVIGDPGQLPPLRPSLDGFTSRDPDVFLTEIYRQAADSPIIELATRARQGLPLPVGYAKGEVCVLPLRNSTKDWAFRKDYQTICGLNKVRWKITREKRAELGRGLQPEWGEPVMACKNNRLRGFFNGSTGVLQQYSLAEDALTATVDVAFDGRWDLHSDVEIDTYLFRQNYDNGESQKLPWVRGKKMMNELDWAYAITCHKAQGSGWPNICVIDDSAAFREMSSRWLYTAITRAESGLTILTR